MILKLLNKLSSVYKRINTIKENTETLLEAVMDAGIDINAEKTKCMIMYRHQNSGQNQNIRIANELFWKCGKILILGNDTNKSE
jgi:hypothetical protein